MTCIAAIIGFDGSITMGADSYSESAGKTYTTAEPKIFKIQNLLIGSAGRTIKRQVLQHGLCNMKPYEAINETPEQYLATTFTTALKSTLVGIAPDDNETELLVAVAGCKTLFIINLGDYAVSACPDFFAATGSGSDHAVGAMTVLTCNEWEVDDERVITLCLEAAGRHCPTVAPPFTILKLDAPAKFKEKVNARYSRHDFALG